MTLPASESCSRAGPRASTADVARLVESAMQRIDEDAPDYGEPLRALCTTPGALTRLAALPALAEPLFVELRKLRPFPLWVRDAPARALALKQLAKLDGAICVGSTGVSATGRAEPWLAAQGRECWREVPLADAEAALRTLPPGWGLIVRGELARVPWAALRRASPLRALGAALDGVPGHVLASSGAPSTASDIRLDLVTLDAERAHEASAGARVLWVAPALLPKPAVAPASEDGPPSDAFDAFDGEGLRALAEETLSLTARAAFSSVLLPGDLALACALWFATVRSPSR